MPEEPKTSEPKTSEGCDCCKNIEELFPENGYEGVRVDRNLFRPHQALVSVYWAHGFKKPRGAKLPALFANYCPFCGRKYEEEDSPKKVVYSVDEAEEEEV